MRAVFLAFARNERDLRLDAAIEMGIPNDQNFEVLGGGLRGFGTTEGKKSAGWPASFAR